MAERAVLSQYYKELKEKFDSHSTFAIENKDRCHNAVIVRFMLEEANAIYMYCEQMSVFRDCFYDNIRCSVHGEDESLSDSLKEDVRKALKTYLEQGRKLNIILRRFDKAYLTDLIAREDFKKAAQRGDVNVYRIVEDLVAADSLAHFTFTDNRIMRLEQDKELHSALCGVWLPENLHKLMLSNFERMMKASAPINLEGYLK